MNHEREQPSSGDRIYFSGESLKTNPGIALESWQSRGSQKLLEKPSEKQAELDGGLKFDNIYKSTQSKSRAEHPEHKTVIGGKTEFSHDENGKKVIDMTAEKVKEGTHFKRFEDGSQKAVAETITLKNHNGLKEFTTQIENGKPISYKAVSMDGTIVEQSADHKRMQIKTADGTNTVLSDQGHGYMGQMTDGSGRVSGEVSMNGNKMFVQNKETGEISVQLVEYTGSDLTPQVLPSDLDKGIGVRPLNDGGQFVESLVPGRYDRVSANGDIQQCDQVGDTTKHAPGYLNSEQKASGEALVIREDGSSVHLSADGQISFNDADGHKGGPEALTKNEQEFLNKHPDGDRRDLAEIHMRLHGDREKIDAFYESLGKIDGSTMLNQSQKDAVEKSIMRHVANPSEITQGQAGTCYATVVERDLAIVDPVKYSSSLAQMLTEGKYTMPSGEAVPLNISNYMAPDRSGRDLASRVFQSAASEIAFAHTNPPAQMDAANVQSWSRGHFEATPDGMGKLTKADGKTETYPGITTVQVVELEKAFGQNVEAKPLHSAQELSQAYLNSGGKPIIASVNTATLGKDATANTSNHFVSVIDVKPALDAKGKADFAVFVENQAGLNFDHSTKSTALSGKQLLHGVQVNKLDELDVIVYKPN